MTNTITTLGSAVNPSVSGQLVTFAATVSPTASGATPTGSVTFTVSNGGPTLVGYLDDLGSTVVSTTALGVGSYTVNATYGGDSNFAPSSASPLTQVVNQASTTVTISASPNPANGGQSVVFTTTVSAVAPGSGTPTGLLAVNIGGFGLFKRELTSGQNSFSVSDLLPGVYTLSASYGGDDNFNEATSSQVSLTVSKVSTTTGGLTSSPNPSVYGQTVTLTASVASNAKIFAAPSGTVTFTIDGTQTLIGQLPKEEERILGNAGRPIKAGPPPIVKEFLPQATVTISTLTPGQHSITAAYNGDSNFTPSTTGAPIVQTVIKASSTTTLASPWNPSTTGETVTFSSTVTGQSGLPAPTGTVTFAVGGGPSLTGTLNPNGQATVSISSLSVGSHAVTATYAGDANFSSSTSASITQTVNQAVGTAKPASSSNPSMFGKPVSFTAGVAISLAPAGTITFFDGDSVIGTAPVASSGTATVATSSLGIGPHSITAQYQGNGGTTGSMSEPLFQVVQGTPAVTVTTKSQAPAVNTPITFTVAVTSPAAGAPEPIGAVRLMDGTAALGTAMLSPSGQATFAISGGLSAGNHSIVAQYTGDIYYAPASSAPLMEQIAKNTSTTTLSAAVGDNVLVLKSVVTGSGLGIPTGTVQFVDAAANTSIGSGALANGSFTLTLRPPFGLGHTIQAVYSGDANFAGSSSGLEPLTVAVNTFSYALGGVAQDQFVTLFGSGFGSGPKSGTSGTTVTFADESGKNHAADLLFVSGSQINLIVPHDLPLGPVEMSINTSAGKTISLGATVQPVSPGIATCDGTLAAAQFVVVHPDGTQSGPTATAVYDEAGDVWKPVAPVWGTADQLYLVLYATGFRHAPGSVACSLGGETISPDFSGPQDSIPGLDQLNLHVPVRLRGAGLVQAICSTDAQTSNGVSLALH